MATNTASSLTTHTGNGSTTAFAISFSFLADSEIDVTVAGVAKTITTHYTISGSTLTFTSGNTPANGAAIRFQRDTDISAKKVDFQDGSVLTEADLDTNSDQVLFAQQEIIDKLGTIEEGATADQTAAEIRALVESATDSNVFTDADHTKLNSVESNATADQTAAEIRTLVESASDSNVFTDADHTKLNGVESGATADQTNAEIRAAVEAATDSNVFTDADHTKLNGVETGATADQTVSEIKGLIAGSPLDSSHLAANSVGDSELASTQLTTLAGMQSGTASKLADNTSLTADLADLNQLDGMAKQTTITDDDTKFPTSGAIVDYVAAQLAPIGGFEVIATDAAFPNTQPASGVVISIADGGGLVVNGSGTSTTGRTVGGSTVTINNFASNFNSSTVDAGVAILVSSTGSGQVYNYHKATLKEADLLSLSGDINDFAERYRVVNGEPTSGNDEGDLIYDKNADAIKVFDSSTNTFKLINSVGDFKFLFLCPTGGSGAPTFDGNTSTYDLRVGSNNGSAATVTNAAQLIVSIDGVIQKPNTGTSQPSEGFAMVDSNTIVFGSNLAAGVEVFISQIGDEVNIGTPHDNTVSTAKLQNLAVTGDKVATNLDLVDNKKIRFGTGNDLSIYHNGTESLIQHTGSGVFKIEGNGSNNVFLRAKTAENSVTCVPDGGVSLFHNNISKFETTSSGTTTQGNVFVTGTAPQIRLNGDSNDSSSTRAMFGMATSANHFVSNSTANDVVLSVPQDFLISHDSDYMARFRDDLSVELYYDGAKKFETLSDGVNVTGTLKVNGSAISTGGLGNVVDDTTPQLGGNLDSNTRDIHLNNSGDVALRWQLSGTNKWSIFNNSSGGNALTVFDNNGNGTSAKFVTNAQVELYYDNSKKLETGVSGEYGSFTVSNGANGWSGMSIGGATVFMGNGTDAGIWNDTDNEWMLKCNRGAATELQYDGSKKLETTSTGITVTSNVSCDSVYLTGNVYVTDNNKLKVGTSNDLEIYHDGSNSWLVNSTGNLYIKGSDIRLLGTNNDNIIKGVHDGAVESYYDGSKKFETTSYGGKLTGTLLVDGIVKVDDNDTINIGSGSDLKLYHDGSNSYIRNATGYVFYNSSSGHIFRNLASNEDLINAYTNQEVSLYYDNSKKLMTTSYGASVGENASSSNALSGLSNYQFYAGFDTSSSSSFGGIVLGSGPNGNSPYIAASRAGNQTGLNLGLRTNGSVRLLIQNNGNIGAPSGSNIYYASDQRLKKNVTSLDKGLESINALRPVSFNWIDGFCDVEKDPLYGFIAQEVQTVDSNLVSPFGDDVEIGDDPNNPDQVITDPLRVNEKFIIPMLVKAMQELSAKVEILETKVAALEGA